MIITCQKCHARFRLDDSRVTDKGVKVRCTKCKNVFTVQKSESEVEAFTEQESALSGFSSSDTQSEVSAVAGKDHQFAAGSFQESPFDTGVFEDTPFHNGQTDFGSLNRSPFDDPTVSFESDVPPFGGADNEEETAVDPAAMGGGIDFSNIDFGESSSESDSTPHSTELNDTMGEAAPVASQQETPQKFGFSDEMFAVAGEGACDPPSETDSSGAETDSFTASMDTNIQGSSDIRSSLFSLDTSGDAPGNADGTDRGDEYASVTDTQSVPDDPQPSRNLYSPLVEEQDRPSDVEVDSPVAGEELPPLVIASRRKRSPIFAALITVVAVVLISVLGYFGYSSFSAPKDIVAPETGGKISIRAVKAFFVKNDTAGELLVVSGEALNEYPKPRAALQVKVSVLDAANHSIATKSAYGGNPLTKEQLETLPLDKIEATMANQFGDSLANLELAPGKAIPFVVVLANLPEGAKDFTVESAGSTVASMKQQ